MLAVLAALVPAAIGQQLLAELKLPGEFDPIGNAVGSLADLNGDGRPELLVAGHAGTFVKSGSDGATLAFSPFLPGEEVLAVDGAGDLDADGMEDFVTVSRSLVRGHSGADASVLWSLPASLGSNSDADVEALGDLNGDGLLDVAVAEPHVAGPPMIRVLSANGQVHVTHLGLGESIAAVEWDGSPGLELAVGDPDFTQPGDAPGRVRVIEPLSGATLATFVGGPNDHLGTSVVSPGDLNGDGVPDLVASSSHTSGGTMAWSGATGTALYFLPSTFFRNLETVSDVTGDGRPDWIGGGPGFGFGSATLRNGATGAVIQGIFGIDQGSFQSFEVLGDVSGDGLPDLLVGSTGVPNWSPASARLHSLPSGGLYLEISNPGVGGSLLGRSLDHVGDYDGDGQEDLVLGRINGAVIFATDGELLAEIEAPTTPAGGVFTVAGPGDVDGDGVPDVVLSNPSEGSTNQGRLALYSGSTGAELHALAGAQPSDVLGKAVVDVPDRNGDGVRDLYVGVPGTDFDGVSNTGEVRLLSGATLAQLGVLHGDLVVNEYFGWTLDVGSDLDQDGVLDLAVGSQGSTLYVLSGATGVELARQTSAGAFNSIYGNLVGDADGDGTADYLARVPAFYASPTPSTQAGGRVQLFSGATDALLWEQVSTVAFGRLGEFAAGVGDVNGDGYADVAMTERRPDFEVSAGTVWVRSGKDGALLDQYVLPPSEFNFGPCDVMPAGLVDAGGCSDLVVGIQTLGNNGGARVLASSKGGVHGFIDLGFAKPGTGGLKPTLNGYGNLAAGGQVSIKVRHARPTAAGGWFIGLAQGNHAFKQGVLVPSVLGPYFLINIGTNGLGELTITANNSGAVFAGLSLYHQFWFVDPAATAGLSATNGMREIFK